MKKTIVFISLWVLVNVVAYILFFEVAYRLSWGIFITLFIVLLINMVFLVVTLLSWFPIHLVKKRNKVKRRLFKYSLSAVVIALFLFMQGLISEQFVYMPGDSSMNRFEEVDINGTTQYMSVRTTDEDNPVLLFLAGGPGGSQIQATREHFGLLEEHFTIINWEQPGSGMSYDARATETLSPDVYVDDAHALTEHLKETFGKDKIYLMGESWGSYLGVALASEHPEDYHMLFTTGQMVDFAETEAYCYDEAMRIAVENDDQRQIDSLESLSTVPPVGDNISLDAATYLNYLHGHMANSPDINRVDWDTFDTLMSPEYSIEHSLNFFRGLYFTFSHVYQQLYETDLRESHTELSVPIHILHGEHDVNAPVYLVDEYYALIDAPDKSLTYFDRSGHNPWISEPELFQQTVIDIVNP